MNLFPYLPAVQTGYGHPIFYPAAHFFPQMPPDPIQSIINQAALNALTFLGLGNPLITGSQSYINPIAGATSTIANHIFASQETANKQERAVRAVVQPTERIGRAVESLPLSSTSAASSSSSPPLSTSSTSIRENQIESTVASNTEIEKEVNESESHSSSSKSKPTLTKKIKRKGWLVNEFWTWPKDKELVTRFNEVSQTPHWAKEIKKHFPDQEIKELGKRLRDLRKRAKKTNGVLFPYPDQIGRIEGDSIEINPPRETENIKKSYARGKPSEYWTWKKEERLIDAFNTSKTSHWRKEIAIHFPGQSFEQIGNRLNHIADPISKRIDITTGRIKASSLQKDAKEGDFATLDMKKWNSLKKKRQKIKKTAAAVINATESLRSISTAGLHLSTASTSSSAAATIAATTSIETRVENWEEEEIAAGLVPIQESGRKDGGPLLPLSAAASSSSQSLSTSSTSIREIHSSNGSAKKTDDSERAKTEKEMSESESNSSSPSEPKRSSKRKWTWTETTFVADFFNKASNDNRAWVEEAANHFPDLKPIQVKQHFSRVLHKTLKNGRIHPLSYQRNAKLGITKESSFEITNIERIMRYHSSLATKMQTPASTTSLHLDSSTPTDSSLSSRSGSLNSSSSSHVIAPSSTAAESAETHRKRKPNENLASAKSATKKRKSDNL